MHVGNERLRCTSNLRLQSLRVFQSAPSVELEGRTWSEQSHERRRLFLVHVNRLQHRHRHGSRCSWRSRAQGLRPGCSMGAPELLFRLDKWKAQAGRSRVADKGVSSHQGRGGFGRGGTSCTVNVDS
eukprot:scaffold48_cov394-Pavlova_lutheri.AAC.3